MPLVDALLSIAAPHVCISCQAEGALLCAWCTPDAFPALPSRCYRCSQATSEHATCARCRTKTKLRQVWPATAYDHAAKQLLHRYKFERTQTAANVIAEAISDVLPYLAEDTLIVPVPTATVRIRERGYDHAVLLARALARRRRRQWSRAVTRLTQSRQVGATRSQRLSQLQDAFVVVRPELVRGADILLVDDVITTGATLEAVSRVLAAAGSRTIHAATFAQKPKA